MTTHQGLQGPPKTPYPAAHDAVFSSSPAFGTPAHPIRTNHLRSNLNASKPTTDASHGLDYAADPPEQRPAPVLPIHLPPATLRSTAWRIFTQKHNLTLTSSALQALANFIGKHCGAGWREEGLAEMVLEEVARSWTKVETQVIVDGNGVGLKSILRQLEGSMSGGRMTGAKAGNVLSRQGSLNALTEESQSGLERQRSFRVGSLEAQDEDEEHRGKNKDPRSWLNIINAFDQPRMLYNPDKKHFERSQSSPSLFPPPSQKTELFRQRYHIAHQRLLRNEAFQSSLMNKHGSWSTNFKPWMVTPIANLLGRSGTGHLLLGLLSVSPTGTLAINDLTGSIYLDLEQASPIDQVETWLCAGMIVMVDGVYEEEYSPAGGALGSMGGIGGTIGGRFIGFQTGTPRCETRSATLGISESLTSLNGDINTIGGGFGWVDFLGQGSERAVGARMRKLEQQLLHRSNDPSSTSPRQKIVILGEVNLDNPQTFVALRTIFGQYSSSRSADDSEGPPLAFVLFGNFVQHAAMAGGPDGSIEYKEYFDALAALLSDFPDLLRSCTFVFVPGDNDPWASAFSSGSATPLPRQPVPEMFTNRVRRTFASANSEIRAAASQNAPGEAVWTTNPSRISLFGPVHELVLFRDDLSGRFRRNAIPLGSDSENGMSAANAVASHNGSSENEPSAAISQSAHLDDDGHHRNERMNMDPTTLEHNEHNANRDVEESSLTACERNARRLTKTLLDQCHLSPFPLSIRPQQWSFATSSLSLYPLPSSLVLCDPEDGEAWTLVYQGCCVINCGPVLVDHGNLGRRRASWVEYNVIKRRAIVKECAL